MQLVPRDAEGGGEARGVVVDVEGVRERRGCFAGVGSAAVDDAPVDLGQKGNGEGRQRLRLDSRK